VLKGFKHDLPITVVWNGEWSLLPCALIPLLSILFTLRGLGSIPRLSGEFGPLVGIAAGGTDRRLARWRQNWLLKWC